MSNYVIGVTVGMEYVDGVMRMDTSMTTAVCLQGDKIVASSQILTTADDVFTGVKSVIQNVLQGINSANVVRVVFGTPQVLNAVIGKQDLSPVTVVRLCGPTTQALLPFVDVPDDIKPTIKGDIHLLSGGYEFSGNPGANEEITPVNVEEVLQCTNAVNDAVSSVDHVVICGVYSPDECDQEAKVASLFTKYCPNVDLTLSHEVISKNGLLERENASILNASLKKIFQLYVKEYGILLKTLNIFADYFIVQNNQTLISGNDLTGLEFPVNTFFSQQACTLKAAPFLSASTLPDPPSAIAIDIDGTVSKAGILTNGQPRFQTSTIDVSGIRTYSNSAYVVTYDLGLFSKVHTTSTKKPRAKTGPILSAESIWIRRKGVNNQNETLMNGDEGAFQLSFDSGLVDNIGPDCVDSYKDALVYGGSILTCLDIAVADKLIVDMGDPSLVANLPSELITQALDKIHSMIEDLIDLTKESSENIPAVLLGKGSAMIDETKPLVGTSKVIKPDHYQVADAVGAAIMEQKTGTPRSDRHHSHRSLLSPNAASFGIQAARHEGIASAKSSKLHGQRIAQRAHKKAQLRTDGKAGDDPDVNTKGEWLLSETDLDYLSIGVGVLGSGGGGSPYLAYLLGNEQLKKGKQIRVIVPERLETTNELTGLASGVSFIGDPKVVLEKLPNGLEGPNSLKIIEDLYSCGYKDGALDWKPAGTITDTTCEETDFIQRFPTVYNPKDEQGLNLVALMPLEIGGMNGFEPLVVSTFTDMPVLDCDGMGRSIPELQMYGPSIYGDPMYPSTLSGYKGERCVALKFNSPNDLEYFFRNQTIQMGSVAVFTLGPLNKKSVNDHTVKYTISQAWHIGKGVIDARNNQQDPVQSILTNENGKLLLKNGKVTKVTSTQIGGFERGQYVVVGELDDGKQGQVTIDFQNENLVAWKGDSSDNVVLASMPDLISLVDEEGNPFTTDAVHFGLRASVLGLPCSPLMRTNEALAKCGPRVFGYDFDYKPIGDYKDPKPIPTIPTIPK